MKRSKRTGALSLVRQRWHAPLVFVVVGLVSLLAIVGATRIAQPRADTSLAAAPVRAEAGTATQTDWSGGTGQASFSDPTKFDSASSISYTTPGQLTLATTPTFAPDPVFSPAGAERQIDNALDTAFPQEGGSVAVLTNGNYVYAWPQDYCVPGCNEYPTAAVVGPDGSSVAAPFPVTDTTNLTLSSTSSVSVAALLNGRFVVAWTIPGGKTRYARFEMDGTALDSLGTNANVCSVYCRLWGRSVVGDTGGNFYIVSESGPSKVRLNGFDQDGNTIFAQTGPLDGSIALMSVDVAATAHCRGRTQSTDGWVTREHFQCQPTWLISNTQLVLFG
jgi:hypothetical protein